jgi:hypothetical protein
MRAREKELSRCLQYTTLATAKKTGLGFSFPYRPKMLSILEYLLAISNQNGSGVLCEQQLCWGVLCDVYTLYKYWRRLAVGKISSDGYCILRIVFLYGVFFYGVFLYGVGFYNGWGRNVLSRKKNGIEVICSDFLTRSNAA